MWIAKLVKSFRFALEGLKYTLVTQRNMRIHIVVALGVLFFSLFLPIKKTEVLLLFMAIVLVLVAELFNTVVEAVVDMVTKEYHPLAKVAKDVAAGAVLLCAGLAVIIGISVFYPVMESVTLTAWRESNAPIDTRVTVVLVFDFFLTLLVKGFMVRAKKSAWEPSMTTSLSFCIATLIAMTMPKLYVALLVYTLAALIAYTRFRVNIRRTRPVVIGSLLGVAVALMGLRLL
ncbi:diacylglycerol kinase family protein [Mechercharimyces sp. CAU 1602]|uniref:diacylglycerol kinase family protein n=1 Tax=Mechercharimyces sp. CAU 1602 TaxID=2973933 RepID=UPI0021615D0D|nr:diacylglycerol kinase family protein [Mechercharimyces sp. CAU 1602]MCS1350474.1 diacylglycerol kinase family protein [Mechercharimyces sp. CAU 1602]